MPTPIKLDSSELWRPSKTEVLVNTITNQIAHLYSASPQSFLSAHVPFSTIHSNLSSGLTSWVQSLAVNVQVSSTPNVSHHVFALLAFEPVTSTTQISSAKTALKAIAEMQALANSNKKNYTSSFNNKPSSTFQLVVASVDWISETISNKPFKTLCLDRIKSKMSFTFQLIVGSKQVHQRIPHRASLMAACLKGLNSHKSSCTSQLVARAKCINSHKSSCASPLALHAKCLIKTDTNIPLSDPEGVQSAEINLQTLWLIVNYICLPNFEGAQQVTLPTIQKESFILIDASNAKGVQASINIQNYR
jgi:hypothetical protein